MKNLSLNTIEELIEFCDHYIEIKSEEFICLAYEEFFETFAVKAIPKYFYKYLYDRRTIKIKLSLTFDQCYKDGYYTAALFNADDSRQDIVKELKNYLIKLKERKLL